jgi:hypothetical protein
MGVSKEAAAMATTWRVCIFPGGKDVAFSQTKARLSKKSP